MADAYAYDTYAGREGERFWILAADRRVEATLSEVTPHKSGPASGFSVMFLAQGDILPQATYTLEHDELGGWPLFIVPIARGEQGVSYEAVFS